jgi:hypothetical protein
MLGQSFLRLGWVDEIRLMKRRSYWVTDCTCSVIPVPAGVASEELSRLQERLC